MERKGRAPDVKRMDVFMVLTILVGIGAGTMTAATTRQVALDTGAVTDPLLAWLVPVIIEGGSLTSAGLAWRRTRMGESAWLEISAFLLLMALAVWVNVSHVQTGSPQGKVLAAAGPIVLLVMVEMNLRGQRTARKRAKASKGAAKPEGPTTAKVAPQRSQVAAPKAAALPTMTEPVAVTTRQVAASERTLEVERLLRENPTITGTAVSKELGVSEQHGRRILKAVKEQMAVE